MWYWPVVERPSGVARISAVTALSMLIAAVCEIAFRLVCAPMGNRAKIAIRLTAVTPSAIVTSISEKADELDDLFTGEKLSHYRRCRRFESLRRFRHTWQ